MLESSAGPAGRSSTPLHGRNADLPRDPFKQFGTFRDLVVFAFPGPKPEVALAELTKSHDTTVRRWLRGETEPPASVFALVLSEFLWRVGTATRPQVRSPLRR